MVLESVYFITDVVIITVVAVVFFLVVALVLSIYEN